MIYTIASVNTAANTVTVQGSFNNAANVRALWLAQPASPTATSPLMKILILPNSGNEYIQ
ncbi:MAG: hypothetical protein HC898_03070 [Phycisphaerales bacterium]|nr:hypothetical protein [Phycisphaerales bacterium]